MRVAVFASGRGSNFDALAGAARGNAAIEIAAVFCDKPGAIVREKASSAGIETVDVNPGTRRGAWTEEAVEDVLGQLARRRIEVICLAGFLRVLPPAVVRAFPSRILNIHPSLLPSFPGLHAPRQALRAGAKVSGCTVHFVDEGVDTGPILAQAAVPVRPEDTEDTLAARILEQEHRIYPEVLVALAEGRIHLHERVAWIATGVTP
ncbi:MAG: phosphoribosylglycinamide formyltransferase [bacterium]